MARFFGPREFFYSGDQKIAVPKRPKKAIEHDGYIYVLKDDMDADLRLRDTHIKEVNALAIRALAASIVALFLSAAALTVAVLR